MVSPLLTLFYNHHPDPPQAANLQDLTRSLADTGAQPEALGDRICIAEGFATGVSIRDATGYTAVVAFAASNVTLGVRPGTLEKLVTAARKQDDDGGMDFMDVEPWQQPINPAALREADEPLH